MYWVITDTSVIHRWAELVQWGANYWQIGLLSDQSCQYKSSPVEPKLFWSCPTSYLIPEISFLTQCSPVASLPHKHTHLKGTSPNKPLLSICCDQVTCTISGHKASSLFYLPLTRSFPQVHPKAANPFQCQNFMLPLVITCAEAWLCSMHKMRRMPSFL